MMLNHQKSTIDAVNTFNREPCINRPVVGESEQSVTSIRDFSPPMR